MTSDFYVPPRSVSPLRPLRLPPWARPTALALVLAIGPCVPSVPQQVAPTGGGPSAPLHISMGSPPAPPPSLPSELPPKGAVPIAVPPPVEPPLSSPEAQTHAQIPTEPTAEFVDHPGVSEAQANQAALNILQAPPVQDAPSGRPPKPTPKDKADIYPRSTGVQTVQDDPSMEKVYPVDCLVNHSTVFKVPGTVLKAWCGDLRGWQLEGGQSYVAVRPNGADLSTNLHILTESGRLYTWRLWSHAEGDYTDLFLVQPSASYEADVQALERQRTEKIRQEVASQYDAQMKQALQEKQFDWVSKYAQQTFWNYRIEKPSDNSFIVTGVFNDATFTYFHVTGDEKPTVFLEAKSGGRWVRELLNFDVTGGDFYRVQKILMSGQRLILKLRSSEAVITRKD